MPSWQAWISGDKPYGRTRLTFLSHEHCSSVVPWRVWEPTPAVQFHAQFEASASKKSAVWAWNPYYAATQPDEQFWRHYVLELEKLKQNGDVSTEQYYLLRFSLNAKELLMELTVGEENAFVQGTVPEILARIERNIQKDIHSTYENQIESQKSEIGSLSSDIDMVLTELQSKDIQEQDRNQRIRGRAIKFAKVISWILTVLAVVLVAVATYFTLPGEPLQLTGWKHYILSVLFGALLFLSVGNLVFGTTLITLIQKLEENLSRYIEGLLLSIAE